MYSFSNTLRFIVGCSLIVAAGVQAQAAGSGTNDLPRIDFKLGPNGSVIVNGRTYSSWQQWQASDFYRHNVRRCGTPDVRLFELDGIAGGSSDCTYTFTNPEPQYDPSVVKYRIPTVVHVMHSITGEGYISPEMVQSQIDVLNEDFLALAGSLGEPGTNVQIEFYLATTDPKGNPSTGITYTANDAYFLDQGLYYNNLAWDPHNYMNIYTCIPMGAGGLILGYVPFLPQDGPVGSFEDRVVVLWSSFGRNSPNAPYHLGRTTTHEVGHYLGLFHVFQDGCGTASPPGCFSTGDRVCDTNPDATSHGGCPTGQTCGFPIPAHNYMEYTDDICMYEFSPQQARRARCTLENWRPSLGEIEPEPTCDADVAPQTRDGVVNVDDLLAVINSWGPCSGCDADIDENGTVNVDDLLAVINAWGPCP